MKIALPLYPPVVPMIANALGYQMTRDQLRKIAKDNNIPRGRNKADTLKNLMENIECIESSDYSEGLTITFKKL